MAWSIRSLVTITVPALGLLLGLFWFRKRKSSNSLDYPKPPDKAAKRATPVEETELEEKGSDLSGGLDLGSCAEVQGPPLPAGVKFNTEIEEEMVAVSESSVSHSAPAVQDDYKLPDAPGEVVNNNISESVKSEDEANVSAVEPGVQEESNEPVVDCSGDETEQSVEVDCVVEGTGENTSYISWGDCVEQEQSMINDENTTQAENSQPQQGTDHTEARTCEADVGMPSSPASNPQEHSRTDSKHYETEHNSDTSKQCSANLAASELGQSLSVTNGASSGVVCVNTEEEVSSTLSGDQTLSTSLAVSSESPNSMNSTGSSDSGSYCDHDIRSEVSADSGRGGSVVEMSSPVTIPDQTPVVYEFDFPTDRCGMLIGKSGRTINRIKDLAGVEISVNKKLYTQDYQLVVLTGVQCRIDKALTLLRDRFPIERFPDITFEMAHQDGGPMLQPEMMQLSLPDGVFVDVLVSSVVSPNHVFLQQPTHPTFHMLETLNQCMNVCYSQENQIPLLPTPIETGVICAAPMYDTGWYRSQIVQSYPETDEIELKFVDFGGYMTSQGCLMRQIRSDFSQLPFQAVECYLANVMPPNGADAFPAECSALMEQMVQGKMLQAQVVGHEADGVPYIQLYDIQGDQTVFINRELVNSGTAQWIEHLL